MTLGIVILNWNQSEDTIACVRLAQSWPLPKRIWVVDNASRSDDVQRIVAELNGVEVLLSETNLGFAGGNNLALHHVLQSDCEAVLLFNNDARADGEAILQLQGRLSRDARIGVIGPVLVDTSQPVRILSAGGRDIAWHLSSHIPEPITPDALHYVDYVPGTCVMIRTEVLRTVGLLDEAYFFGGELADFCIRARRCGWLSAIDSAATVQHAVDRSAELRQSLHIYYVIRNRFLYIRKFYSHARLPLFAIWTIHGLSAAMLALAKGQRARARTIALACWDGWRGRFGGQNARVTDGQIE